LLVVLLSWRLNRVPRVALLLVIALLSSWQTLERSRAWRSYETLVDVDFRAFPGLSIPAMYETDIQLSHGLIREAGETAGGITTAEVRNNMIKLVEAHRAVIDSALIGNPNNAMDMLLDFGLDLKELPVQARLDTTLGGIWRINRNYLEFEWRNLVRYFPDDMLLRYNAGSSLLSIQKYESAIFYLQVAAESQYLPESVRGRAFRNLGVALLDGGYVPNAEAVLRKALEQSPPELSAYCSLSEVYKRTGRIEDAARAEAECGNRMRGQGIVK
jgi:tetratricopeptide (TPR) repeat protein